MMKQTEIQRRIERTVTNDRGFDRGNTARIPYELMGTEVGLQIALANMDAKDCKMTMDEIVGFSSQLKIVLKRFEEARIPIDVIADANGFSVAFGSAYAVEGRSLHEQALSFGVDLFNRESSQYDLSVMDGGLGIFNSPDLIREDGLLYCVH